MKAVDEQYEIYDLITAMQAFKFYASGDELEKYFDDYLSRKSEKEDKKLTNWIRKLAETIQKISEAIRLCDMDGFDKELLEFKKLAEERYDNLEQKTEFIAFDSKKTPMDIVFEDIYRDYEKILPSLSNRNQKQSNYIEKIRWCVKKGFIQQALTIVESQMPTVILDSGKLDFSWEKRVVLKCSGKEDLISIEAVIEKKKILGK